jgi:ribosomal protein S6
MFYNYYEIAAILQLKLDESLSEAKKERLTKIIRNRNSTRKSDDVQKKNESVFRY